ncbi:uncharacterized protein BCR38DRAFT_414254 [Pseudomassariella vexata]|uniref:HSF-type DNA-binding domain-containing protein n=1 Tax=Pseudomassariella vexata TaxID=1141098 RepID=A0A1Y2DCE4_9PEZI|nr:uncharacterized protein BCR38DRAFT_414254 [Pseudomassariella vexata]ORY56942.1 hypothetical protein BCR38DRAFT_414254 [Pseudomassariella vexata]
MSPPHPNPNPRKRPAPGTIPISIQQPYLPPNPTPDQVRWNGNNANYAMMSPTTPGAASGYPSQPTPVHPAPSTALARRGMNNQLVAANRAYSQPPSDPWSSFVENNQLVQPNGTTDEHDNIEVLEERAQRAKREAQAKRKQIPPFVQKLNRQESKNTELIRWSDKGDSFIVLDEDEFAKTLIPELFKHNNYASFVRQLNMYGFHKKVGLSDNSMKASERKNKSPSEYYNPYFKRGHPNLLWLINKPKSGNAKKKGKRAEDGDADSDEEVVAGDEPLGQSYVQHPAVTASRALPAPDNSGPPLQKKELAVVRDQMHALREQQKQISEAIARLHREHHQLQNQAIAFQEMHSRHENSINAILNFLANVFRKSLEEQGGTQNVSDILASIMNPNGMQMPQGQHQGSVGNVVDLGEYVQQQPGSAPATSTPKRTQRLLPPIPQQAHGQDQEAVRPTLAGATPASYNNHQITELFDMPLEPGTSPSYLKHELESNPQEGMMKIIHDANINTGRGDSPINLQNVAAATPSTMPEDQRSRMLSIMSGGQGSSTSPPAPPVSSAPPMPASSPTSLSPLMGSSAPLPSLAQLSVNQEELDRLHLLQEQQNHKLENLTSLLGPYSPSGRIPGLDGSSGNYFDDNIDFGQYLDTSAYNADAGTGDFDFSTPAFDGDAKFEPFSGDGLNIDYSTGIVDTVNTPTKESPSSAATEEIPRDDLVEDESGRAAKRQRKS